MILLFVVKGVTANHLKCNIANIEREAKVSELVLVRYIEDFGRMGSLESLFICTMDQFYKMLDHSSIYAGEVLGKHSDISLTLNASTLTIVSRDEDKIKWLREVVGDTCVGFGIQSCWEIHVEDDFCEDCRGESVDEDGDEDE